MTINHNNESTPISDPVDSLISPSKISSLIQGGSAGTVVGNSDECIEQKIFYYEVVADNERAATETKMYKEVSVITNFIDKNGIDRMKEMIQENYDCIKAETKQIAANELQCTADNPDLCYLLPKKEEQK